MSYANTFARREIKYLLSGPQAQALEQAMTGRMQADGYGLTAIHNLYCDSPDFMQLRRSIEGPVYKEKLRLRRYGNADTAFLELKKKYDGVVYKRRAELPLKAAMVYLNHHLYPVEYDCQPLREMDYTLRHWQLVPQLYLAYDRVAYYGVGDREFRMTLDRNIRFRHREPDFAGTAPCAPLLAPGQVLLEVKANGAFPPWLVAFLSQNRIYPVSFSKAGRAYQTLLTQKEITLPCLKVS